MGQFYGSAMCCQTNANQPLQEQWRRLLCRTKTAPLGKSGGSVKLGIDPAVEMALQVELLWTEE